MMVATNPSPKIRSNFHHICKMAKCSLDFTTKIKISLYSELERKRKSVIGCKIGPSATIRYMRRKKANQKVPVSEVKFQIESSDEV